MRAGRSAKCLGAAGALGSQPRRCLLILRNCDQNLSQGTGVPEEHLQVSLMLRIRRSERHQLGKNLPTPPTSSLCSSHPGTGGTWVSEEKHRAERMLFLSPVGKRRKSSVYGNRPSDYWNKMVCINRRNQRTCCCPSFTLEVDGICHRPHPRGKGRAGSSERVLRDIQGRNRVVFSLHPVSLAYSTRMTAKMNFLQPSSRLRVSEPHLAFPHSSPISPQTHP